MCDIDMKNLQVSVLKNLSDTKTNNETQLYLSLERLPVEDALDLGLGLQFMQYPAWPG